MQYSLITKCWDVIPQINSIDVAKICVVKDYTSAVISCKNKGNV